MARNYQKQIDLYEEALQKNEKDIDIQLKEIDLCMKTRLTLEDHIEQIQNQLQVAFKDIRMLQVEKKNQDIDKQKLKKLLYGPGTR